MPRLRLDDSVELHWEERGDGPLVVIVPHWSGVPEVFDSLIDGIVDEHRVVRYDARGTGESTRVGPHDLETSAADLEAVVDASGGDAVLVGMLDACNYAVRVAANRADLVSAVITIASFPAALRELEQTDSMIGSETVVEAFIQMFEADYRGAFRGLTTAGNPQMSEEELRDRVIRQIDYCPHDVAVERLRAYVHDDPHSWATAIGPRLHLTFSPEIAGAWFPRFEELRPLLAHIVPEADVELVDDGILSRPDLTAAIIRRVSAASSVSR
jgi:pimeloyl-ACP methyl ester carboxylesterase